MSARIRTPAGGTAPAEPDCQAHLRLRRCRFHARTERQSTQNASRSSTQLPGACLALEVTRIDNRAALIATLISVTVGQQIASVNEATGAVGRGIWICRRGNAQRREG